MEGHCLTGQSPQWGAVQMEEEEKEEEKKEEGDTKLQGKLWKKFT